MKRLLIAVALLACIAPAYAADKAIEYRELESQLGAIELVDSRRVGLNFEHGMIKGLREGWRRRHHFYQILGPKEYTYKTKDKTLIVTELHDKAIPDMRKYAKQHPFWTGFGQAGQVIGVGANTAGLISH